MKKSEMLDLIVYTFEMEGLGSTMRFKDAYAILSAIEKAGMLPPPYCCISPKDPNPNPIGSCKLYKWEAE